MNLQTKIFPVRWHGRYGAKCSPSLYKWLLDVVKKNVVICSKSTCDVTMPIITWLFAFWRKVTPIIPWRRRIGYSDDVVNSIASYKRKTLVTGIDKAEILLITYRFFIAVIELMSYQTFICLKCFPLQPRTYSVLYFCNVHPRINVSILLAAIHWTLGKNSLTCTGHFSQFLSS